MPEIISNNLLIDEDQTQPITLSNLNAEDSVDSFEVLEFSISDLAGGRFELVEVIDGVETVTVLADGVGPSLPFTGANIRDNQVRFVQDGTETAPSYTVTVTNSLDESTSAPATVTFNPINDFPVFEVNQITVPPDGTVVLNNSEVDGSIEVNLRSTDEETADADLIYSVVTVSQGQFELAAEPGVAITEFTQGQADAGDVLFVDGPGSTPPSYTLEVSDGDGGTVVREATLLNPEDFSTNQPPSLTANSLNLKENQTVPITSQFLNATDPDGPDDSLVFTINPVTDPATGESLLAGSFLVTDTDGVEQIQNTFTRADIIFGRVRFRHDTSNNAPQYTVQVSDGEFTTEPEAAVVNFQAVNDQPLFTTNTLSITEGASVILAEESLLTTDEESGPEALTYTITDVSSGSFALIDPATGEVFQPLMMGGTFTQADVSAGIVQFTHDGSELAPAYTLEVADAGINDDPATVLSVSRQVTLPPDGFTQVNDPPVLEVNQLTLAEGDTITLNNSQNLRASDIEDNDANLLFTVTEVTNGRFERVIDDTVEVLADGVQDPVAFSQEDVLQSRIRFVHDPATDTAPTYTVAVSDLGDPAQVVSAPAVINFTAEDDAPVLQTFALNIQEGVTVPLTQGNLEVTDEETGPEGITYTVDSAVLSGGVFVRLDDNTPVTSFTQADINAGNVIGFAQDGSNTAPSFSLSVADAAGQTISIESSDAVFDATNDSPIIQIAQLSITEAGSVILTRQDNLEVIDEESSSDNLTYTITLNNPVPEKPDSFLVEGVEQLGPEISFTQAQVNAGQVEFVHGGSNQAPQLEVTVSDTFDPAAEAITLPVDLQIDFTAVNDEPIFATNTLSITEGESRVLDGTNLSTTDEESGPEALTYTITDVSNGSFALIDPATGEVTQALEAGDGFTQADVAAGVVQFTHDGSELAPNYTLEVTDTGLEGDPETALSVSREVIIPPDGFVQVNDPPILETNQIALEEGDTIILSSQNLSATDVEDNNDNLIFTISEISNGRFERVIGDTVEVLADGVQAPVPFTQADILQSRIRFIHDPATDAAPAYTVAVSDLGEPAQVTTAAAAVDFTAVNDLPVLQTFALTIGEGETVPLTQAVLEVSDEETAPEGIIYTVDETSLTGGQFVLLADSSPVTSFSQADINAGDVVGFAQDGSNVAPSFSLNVVDGPPEEGGNSILIESGEVDFIAVNDEPQVQIAQLTVTENETIILSGDTNLSTLDEESGPEGLTYTVTLTSADPDQPDRFTVAGEEQTGPDITFTQAQINAGEVEFIQGGGNQAPQIEMTVQDSFAPPEQAITVPVDFQVAFTAVNDAPVFAVNTLTIEEGQSVVLGSDLLSVTDEESDPAELTHSIDSVSGGTFELIDPATGAVLTALEAEDTFTQANVENGEVQFTHDGGEAAPNYTLTVTDGGIADDPTPQSTTLELTIPEGGFVPVNDPPELTANTLTLNEGETVTLGLANLAATDIDSIDSQLQFFISQVEGGQFLLDGAPVDETVAISPSAIAFNTLVFEDDGLEGAPSYVVTVTDPEGESTEAAAEIIYTPVNDPPEVVTNSFTITEGELLTLNNPTTGVENLLVQDAETLDDTDIVYTIDAVSGGRFATFLNEDVTSFTQQQLNDGDIIFQHDGSEVVPSFTFIASDPDGGETVIEGNIETFIPVNDPPELVIDGFAIDEGATVPLTTDFINAIDPDTPPAEIVFTVGDVEGADFNSDTNGDGTFDETGITSFTLAELGANQIAIADDGDEVGPSFSISVSDGDITTGPVAVVPDFTPVNDVPIAVDDSGPGFIAEANAPLTTASVLANDTDEDLEDSLTITAVNGEAIGDGVPLASGAELSLGADGTFIYNPNGAFDALGATETASDSFEYTISDLSGATAQATVEIVINGVNDNPVAVADGGEGFATDEDTPLQTPSLLANDSDVDANDSLSITAINGTEITPGTPITLASDASLTVNPDGTLAYDPTPAFNALRDGESATESLEYTLSDGNGGTATGTVEIVVAGVNDVPVAQDDSGDGFTTSEAEVLTTAVVTTNDLDPDAGDILTITQVNGSPITVNAPITLESGAQLSLNGDNSFTYDPAGAFSSLVDGETATEAFSYTVADSSGASDTAAVEILINGSNSAPEPVPDVAATNARDAIVLDVLSNDVELDADDPLTLTQINGTNVSPEEEISLESGATVTFNEDGTLTYQPQGFGDLGPIETALETFEYTVTDSQGNTAIGTVELTINGLVESNEAVFNFSQYTQLLEQSRGVDLPFDPVLVGGLEIPLLFDETFYQENNPDVAGAIARGEFSSGYEHFVLFGQFENRNPSSLFNQEFYLAANEDVAAAVEAGNTSAFLHFASIGHIEGRNPSNLFDQSLYLENNPDVVTAIAADAFDSGFDHFISNGAAEGRLPNLLLFEESFYLANNQDVAASVDQGLFQSGFQHYVSFGQREGRDPSVLFDESSYLELNPDVLAAKERGVFASGFEHFVLNGRTEGRQVFA